MHLPVKTKEWMCKIKISNNHSFTDFVHLLCTVNITYPRKNSPEDSLLLHLTTVLKLKTHFQQNISLSILIKIFSLQIFWKKLNRTKFSYWSFSKGQTWKPFIDRLERTIIFNWTNNINSCTGVKMMNISLFIYKQLYNSIILCEKKTNEL